MMNGVGDLSSPLNAGRFDVGTGVRTTLRWRRESRANPSLKPRFLNVARCENAACGHTHIAYNSCRNRHSPKCQAAASRRWLADREAELLPVPYFHVVYTLPSELRDIAYQNKRVVYDLLMKPAAETTLAIAADPKRLGARIGITAVLHTWGSALTQNPHS
jgi:hypothetical protein